MSDPTPPDRPTESDPLDPRAGRGAPAPGPEPSPGPPEPRAAPDAPSQPPTLKDARRDARLLAWLQSARRPDRQPDLSIGAVVKRIRRDTATTRNRLGRIIEPWERLVPATIKDAARVDGLRGGTLQVIVASPSVSYQLDRLLRSGLREALETTSGGAIRRVRIRVGQVGSDDDDRRRDRRSPRGGIRPGQGRPGRH